MKSLTKILLFITLDMWQYISYVRINNVNPFYVIISKIRWYTEQELNKTIMMTNI